MLKQIRALHQRSARDKEGLFLIEGAKLLNEAFAKGVEVHDVVVSNSYWTQGMSQVNQDSLSNLNVVDDKLFKELVTTQSPCGVIAVGTSRRYNIDDCLRGETTLIAIGEAIQDPGNAGTLVRAALAFGCSGVVLTKGSVDAYNPKVVRSAMGALFSLPVVTGLELSTVVTLLRNHAVRVIGLEPTAKTELESAQLNGAVAVLLGNEGNGLSADALKLADQLVTIPMTDTTESLNVAVCGAVVLYQCAIQRRKN